MLEHIGRHASHRKMGKAELKIPCISSKGSSKQIWAWLTETPPSITSLSEQKRESLIMARRKGSFSSYSNANDLIPDGPHERPRDAWQSSPSPLFFLRPPQHGPRLQQRWQLHARSDSLTSSPRLVYGPGASQSAPTGRGGRSSPGPPPAHVLPRGHDERVTTHAAGAFAPPRRSARSHARHGNGSQVIGVWWMFMPKRSRTLQNISLF